MIHAEPVSAEARLSEDHHFLSSCDHLLDIMQVKPTADQRLAERVCFLFLQRRLKDFFPAAKPAKRRFNHCATQADWDVTFLTRKLGKLISILVSPGKMRD